VHFGDEIEVRNTNRTDTVAQFRITMRKAAYAELANVRITPRGGETVVWPGRMGAGDLLTLEGGTVLLNGIAPAEGLARAIPKLPSGTSYWRFEADVVVPGVPPSPGRALPVGRFDDELDKAGHLEAAVLAPEEEPVELEVLSQEYHPGTFTVVIPWNIPGFTDRFDAADHPRTQILGLVNRVRAAGVEGRVAYRQTFTEDHAIEHALRLRIAGPLLVDQHDAMDALAASSRQGAREDQDVQDELTLSGVMDHTRFDSLNTFA
jgi:hypothetical protein